MVPKNDTLLLELLEEEKQFMGQTKKEHFRCKILAVGEMVKGTYKENENVLTLPHATTKIKDNIYIARETSILVTL